MDSANLALMVLAGLVGFAAVWLLIDWLQARNAGRGPTDRRGSE
jgi:hypothetical protein